MTRRIVTAREQRDLLSPWLIQADAEDDRKRKPAEQQQDSKGTTTEISEEDWSGDDNTPHAPGAVISQNPYAPDPYSQGSGAYYPAQFSSGGGGSGGGSSQSYGPRSTGTPSGGPPSASLTQALQKAGIDPAMYPLIQGFSAAEGNNPSGAPTLGFTDSQAGTTLDDHANALAQQLQDRQSVAGPFPGASASPQDQASWMATVVGQNGVESDWQGNAQPARSDYVNSIVQNMPAAPTPAPAPVSGPTASSPSVAPKQGRRILTAREQREMLSPWIIEADAASDDEEEKRKNAPVQKNWGGDGTKPPMYHIPGAEPIHNKFNTGSGEYYPAMFSSGGGGTNGDGGGGGGGHGGKNSGGSGGNKTTLPPIDPKTYGSLNDAADAFGKQVNGMPYAYGHYGEDGNSYDCSGLMANVYSLYTGKPMGERPDSFNTASDFEAFGFQPGYVPGAFNIGTNGGEGEGGHMAGTLPNGMNLESSSSGGVQYGGNALGAQDFDNVYHLPPPPSAAPATPTTTSAPSGGAGASVPATTPATTPAITPGLTATGSRRIVLAQWRFEAESQVAKDIDTEGFISNLMDHFYSATPEQFQKGLWWYRNAHNSIKDASDNSIQDFPKAVAIGAGMSPHNEWGSNLNSLQHFLYNYDPNDRRNWQQPVIHPQAHDEWMRTNRPAAWASRHYTGLNPISDDEYYSGANLPQTDEEMQSYADAHHGVWGNMEQGSQTRQDWVEGLQHWGIDRQIGQMRDYQKSYGKKQDKARNPQTDKAIEKRRNDVVRYLNDQAKPEGEFFPDGTPIPKRQRSRGIGIPMPEYNPRDPIVQAGLPMIGENIDTAKQIWAAPTGSDYTQFLKGPKTHSFYHNVGDDSEIDDEGYYRMPINPETGEEDWTLHDDQDSTVDTIFSKAATTPVSGRVKTEYTAPPSLSAKEVRYNPETGEPELTNVGYEIFNKISLETTRRINEKRKAEGQKPLLPKQVQAIIWIKFKADLDAAKVRNRGEKWEQNHPGETYVPPDPNRPKPQPKTKLKWNNPLYEWWEHENGGMKRQYPRPDDRRPAPDIEHAPNYQKKLVIPAALREAYRMIEAAQREAMEWKHTYVPQDWEPHESGGWTHPSGHEIHPSDEGEGLYQLYSPTVSFGSRPSTLVPVKQPTSDAQSLMDWVEYTLGGPKPPKERPSLLHLHASTALLDDPAWVQSVADAIKGGGFSFYQKPGDGPTSGYSVSTHPDREEIIDMDEVGPEDVSKFMDNNVDLYTGHPENMVGGWANQDNHKFYLDVPEHDPNLWGAVNTALDNDELAIFDLGHYWELPTEDDGQYNPLLDSHFARKRR